MRLLGALASLTLSSLALASLVCINDKSFKDVVIASGKYVLVDFYADWCRHCTTLMPVMEELASLYADVPEIDIVKINGDADGRKMRIKYNVSAFPTLLLFHGNDEHIAYSGLRDAESISNFLQLALGVRLRKPDKEYFVFSPLVLTLNDLNFQDIVISACHRTLVLFSSTDDARSQLIRTMWNQLADTYAPDDQQIRFGHVEMEDANKPLVNKMVAQFGVAHAPTILFFDPQKIDPDGLKRPAYYASSYTLDAFCSYVNAAAHTHRALDGGLTRDAGRVRSIENAFAKNKADAIQLVEDIAAQLQEGGAQAFLQENVLLAADDVSMIPYYKKAIAHYTEGGSASLERETRRLSAMLNNSRAHIAGDALDYMQKRVNVLEALLGRR